MEIFNIENLSFTYPQSDKKALDNISFKINEGDFVCICAPTGSGKTTLLRMLKRELSPAGEKTGKIYYKGIDTDSPDPVISPGAIGYVMQNPNQQIVTDKVWHELAFGGESLVFSPNMLRRRVAEMAGYFGIEKWFDKKTDELSGGQKQLLNLAGVMVMRPDVIILDEPTAQLDPIAAVNFLSTVKRLNRELSVTVIIAEHRLEDVIPICDKLMIMDNGKIKAYGDVREVCENITDGRTLRFLPCAVRIHRMLGSKSPCPLDIKEGRRFITENYGNGTKAVEQKSCSQSSEPALEIREAFFRYFKDSPDVLNSLSLTAYTGEVLCILGANGSGKSTALSAAAGLIRPYSGKIKIFGKKISAYKASELYSGCVAMLPQDVQTVFCKDTVGEELNGSDPSFFPYDISHLYSKHPYDLSGGEQQLAALAKVLLSKPRILLLDEPTKGIDVNTKEIICDIITGLKKQGTAVIAVTHDVEFACAVADRCDLFFRGAIVCTENPYDFFSSNSFYTTSAARMTAGYYENVLTDADAVQLCRLNGPKTEVLP